MANIESLKTIVASIENFKEKPDEFIQKLNNENVGNIEMELGEQIALFMTKEKFDTFLDIEIKKEKAIFEQKYRELKEKFTKVKNDVEVDKLTKAQQTLLALDSKLELFNGLTKGELLAVIKQTKFIKHERGEKVFTFGNTGKEAFFIIQGGIAIVLPDNTQVALLKKNTFFGEMAYITKKARNATAIVKSPVAILLSIEIKDEVDPAKAEAFAKLFQNINSMLVEKVEDMNRKLYGAK
jgi:CRP-like cAMP-binding protein